MQEKNNKKRTVIIGYGVSGDDPTTVYFDRETDALKNTPLAELIRVAQRMGAERIICEDVRRGE